MPVIQFYVSDAVHAQLYEMGEPDSLSANLYTKYLVLGTLNAVTPAQVKEFKRAFDKGQKAVSIDAQIKQVKPIWE